MARTKKKKPTKRKSSKRPIIRAVMFKGLLPVLWENPDNFSEPDRTAENY